MMRLIAMARKSEALTPFYRLFHPLLPLHSIRNNIAGLITIILSLSAQAVAANSVLISVEAPLVTTSQASNVTTETFYSLATGSTATGSTQGGKAIDQ